MRLNEVYIWSLLLETIAASDWPMLEAVLDDAERDRAERFCCGRDRQAFVAAHALTRCMLAFFGGNDARAWRFATGGGGKPRLANQPTGLTLEFSLSHTAGMVAAAVTRAGDVGVDVETVDCAAPPDVLAVADHFFTCDEVAALRTLANDRPIRKLFTRLWTLKEAVVKATGRGLAQQTNGFSFVSLEPVRVRFHTTELGDPAHWAFWQQAVGPHVVAAAVRRPSSRPLRFLHRVISPPCAASLGASAPRSPALPALWKPEAEAEGTGGVEAHRPRRRVVRLSTDRLARFCTKPFAV